MSCVFGENWKQKCERSGSFLAPLWIPSSQLPWIGRRGPHGHLFANAQERQPGRCHSYRNNGKAHTSRTLWFSGVFFVFSGWNNGEKQKIHLYGCDNLNVLGLGYFWEPVWNRTVLSSLPCLRVHSQNNTKQIAQSKVKVQPKLGTWLRNIVKLRNIDL